METMDFEAAMAVKLFEEYLVRMNDVFADYNIFKNSEVKHYAGTKRETI
jgi:hypothetical protein